MTHFIWRHGRHIHNDKETLDTSMFLLYNGDDVLKLASGLGVKAVMVDSRQSYKDEDSPVV